MKQLYKQLSTICVFAFGFVALQLGCQPTSDKAGSDASQANSNAKSADTIVTVGDPVLRSALEGLVDDPSIKFWTPETDQGSSLNRQQVKEIQGSDLIVLDATHGNAKWRQQVSLPQAKMVFSTFDILDQLITVAVLATHSHGPGQPHSHSGIVAETWLDPNLFGKQIQFVLETMQQKKLLTDQTVSAAQARWQNTASPLNQRIETLTSQGPAKSVLIDQAGMEYLARRLNWELETVRFEEKISDTKILSEEIQAWRVDHPDGLIILLSEPTPPLAAVFSQLKESYLHLDLATEKFQLGSYSKSFNDLLDQLESASPK